MPTLPPPDESRCVPLSRERMRASRILIVDDEEVNVRLLRRILERSGYHQLASTIDPRSVVRLFATFSPDLILLDVRMPHVNGFEVLDQLRELIPADTYLPILMLTGDAAPETRQRALGGGARDFLVKPFDPGEVMLRTEILLETRVLHLSLAQRKQDLEEKVRERTHQLEAALSAAELASQAKSAFLANMSHELRTPLNSVIGFANVLLKNKSDGLRPQELAYLQRIGANGRHLLELINGILDLSKVEAGKMEVDRSMVALERVVYETLEELEGRFVGTKVVPRIALPPVLESIQSDAGKLKQVLINLIGNAVKFTEKGSVTVVVDVDERNVPTRIDVVDTGIGIPAHRLAAVFESFEQGESNTSRRYGGTGLGLSISRALCQVMGYRLTAVSDVGRGSMFSILLDPNVPAPTAYPDDIRVRPGGSRRVA